MCDLIWKTPQTVIFHMSITSLIIRSSNIIPNKKICNIVLYHNTGILQKHYCGMFMRTNCILYFINL